MPDRISNTSFTKIILHTIVSAVNIKKIKNRRNFFLLFLPLTILFHLPYRPLPSQPYSTNLMVGQSLVGTTYQRRQDLQLSFCFELQVIIRWPIVIYHVCYKRLHLRFGASLDPKLTGKQLASLDRKSTRLNSSHGAKSRMPSSA